MDDRLNVLTEYVRANLAQSEAYAALELVSIVLHVLLFPFLFPSSFLIPLA